MTMLRCGKLCNCCSRMRVSNCWKRIAGKKALRWQEPESGRLLYLNAAGRKMLGIGPEENLAGLRLADFMGENDTTITPKEKVTQAQQRGMWLGESTLVSRSGSRIPVSKQILIHRSD